MALILKGRAKLKGSTVIGKRPYAIDGVFNPELVLDFQKDFYRTNSVAKTFPNAITHTRASTATYVDSTGTLQTAAINEPRLGHHVYNGTAYVNEGLLHESEARTNLYTNSGDLDGTGWFGFRTTFSAGDTSPDGSELFLLGTASETNSNGSMVAQQAPTLSAGVYTMSVFAKAGPTDTGLLALRPGSNTDFVDAVHAWFDLETGTIILASPSSGSSLVTTPVANIEEYDGGVYRCSLTFTVTGTVACATRHYIANASGSLAATIGKQVQLWGAQLEAAPTPSSYIPTAGSTVTRSADVLTIPAANLPYPEPVVIGPELVTNGTFDTDSDWTLASAWSISGGVLTGTATGGIVEAATQLISGLEVGKVYKVSFDISDVSNLAGNDALVSLGSELVAAQITSSGAYEYFVVAQGTESMFNVRFSSVSEASNSLTLDNISVREINPLALSIQMDGRVTYADEDIGDTVILVDWLLDINNRIRERISTFLSDTGAFDSFQVNAGVSDVVLQAAPGFYSPDILVPFNIASRHGSNFLNGAVDGTALTANTTPTALPNLSATNLSLGNTYNGTIRTFRIWAQDIGDAGLVEATEPSLVPSLSLTFDGTENSFIVNDWTS